MDDKKTADAETYRLDDQVGYVLRLANQRHAAIFQAHTLDGLTPTQFAALVRIGEQGQCSQNRLGRLSAMDVATIKGVVDRLQKKGLIVSAPDPNDRRRMLIALSADGKRLLDSMKLAGQRITAETLEPLSPSEREVFLKLLRRLV
ncbi:MarR family transcriptional regulator [Ruegeria sp.]|uniref:MarR family winged helix-turn-helix transcriptional regulator n=1 Tax=Ruegeria sp. TaxID=1879320 RepID=UPI00231E1209|nr:MarR family transcriptional regulator [Ruegeria sp.]MDA7965087.1 MarR family transcriptional regulator [Ruegeria sp.]